MKGKSITIKFDEVLRPGSETHYDILAFCGIDVYAEVKYCDDNCFDLNGTSSSINCVASALNSLGNGDEICICPFGFL